MAGVAGVAAGLVLVLVAGCGVTRVLVLESAGVVPSSCPRPTTADTSPACLQSRKRAHQAQQAKPEQPTVQTAESLYGKRAVLQDEVARLEQEVAQEQERLLEQEVPGSAAAAAAGAAAGGGAGSAGGDGGGDSLDAFMSVMEGQLEQDKQAGLQRELAATKVGCRASTACVALCGCAARLCVKELVLRQGVARWCRVYVDMRCVYVDMRCVYVDMRCVYGAERCDAAW